MDCKNIKSSLLDRGGVPQLWYKPCVYAVCVGDPAFSNVVIEISIHKLQRFVFLFSWDFFFGRGQITSCSFKCDVFSYETLSSEFEFLNDYRC